MGNVRDKIEGQQFLERQAKDAEKARADAAKKAQQDAQPDFIPRASRSSLVVAAPSTMSTRQAVDFRAAQEPEVLTPSTRQGSSGALTTANAPMTLREKAERRQGLQEIANTPENLRTAAAQFYLDQHNEEVAKQEQWEREKAEEQARINSANEARERENARIIAVRLELDTWRASEVERKRVWECFNRPGSITPEQVGSIIVALREALGGPRPSWAF